MKQWAEVATYLEAVPWSIVSDAPSLRTQSTLN